ncbi:MAG: sodium:solute symporter [Ignavibacteria bacterium]|nr:sodium:solute symporter [Ignavibacteria bacterium]MBT8383263.1 sodium:solute symporter [Ignavibacteria bacterium]MBT8390368.1 sodium:solute symporter [Ignavibacteria bacterium]NNJ53372.1 sodium/solute symporter [Ignavibacteriaceae bacterium]NNL21613.1 sodium/solute symporter [Ignavibacteriaceae bacterium]
MESRLLDYIIIAAYLLAVAFIGIFSGGRQKSVKDYFLGAKEIPWWAVCFSIVSAETSALTFISIPGLAYLTNLNFLQVAFGFLIGRIFVALFFLPAYFKGELETAYKYLDTRFGKTTRSFASIVFLLTRLAADGVRLFATAIPIYLMLQINPVAAIILVAFISLIYTYTGGIKGVIWVDAIQMFIYIGGAIVASIFLFNLLPDGWNSVINAASVDSKLSVFNTGANLSLIDFFDEPYTMFAGIIGGAFLSMASHGTDQLIVQRLLATKNLKSAKKAVIGSGIIIVFQFAFFLVVGILLYAYYGSMDIRSDEIFPKFIIEVLPAGISGLIIAGLLAAAMSTIAGSISSLSSSAMMDIFVPFFGKNLNEKKKLLISRILTVGFASLLILFALIFIESSQAVVEVALSIASFTYGGLLGAFLLGLLNKNAKEREAIIAFTAGIAVMILVISFNLVAWTWFTLAGVITTVFVGSVLTMIRTKELKT